jgi:hypothetical protein
MSEGKELVSLNDEFSEKITPKKIEGNDLFLFKCECGGMHFRHAGYVEMMMPYIKANKEKNVTTDSYPVKVCVKCRKSYVWADSQMYEVTDQIDLEAWEKFEKEAHKATGAGGNC